VIYKRTLLYLGKTPQSTSDVNQLTAIVNQLSASLDVPSSVDNTLFNKRNDKIPENIDLRITAVGKDVTYEQLSRANELFHL